MRTNNSSPGKPGSMPQGAQTVSIGNKHMMTYIPNGEGGSAEGGDMSGRQHHLSEHSAALNNLIKNFDMNNKSLPLTSSIEREESLDDEAFNALDEFLKDDQYDGQFIGIGDGNEVAPPLDNNNENGQGRKRKASQAFVDMSSMTNTECTSTHSTPHVITAAAAAAVASSLQQQQKQDAENATLKSAAAAGTAAAAVPNNMAYSAQGSLVQLPFSLLFPQLPPPQEALSDKPTSATRGETKIGSQEQQQQQNSLANNLMNIMAPATASLFQIGADTPAIDSSIANQAPNTSATSSNILGTNTVTATAFDNLFGFNSIPELPVAPLSENASFHVTATAKPPPKHQSSTAPQSTSLVATADSKQQQVETNQSIPGSAETAMSAASKPNTVKKSTKSGNPKQKRGAKPAAVKSSSSKSILHVSEDEQERKRRSIRNIREQQRSNKIAESITELRTLLQDAGVQHKSDRYSTLVGVVNYVKMLQRRSKKLDEEHKILLKTISGAGEIMSSASGTLFGGSLPPPPPKQTTGTTTVQTFDVSGENSSSISSDRDHDEELVVFVQGIDYRFIFAHCGVGLAIASVDGRFVDCNDEWLRLTGYSKKELMGEVKISNHPGREGPRSTSTSVASTAAHAPAASEKSTLFPPSEILIGRQHLSIFNLLGHEDMEKVYTAMSRMLRSSPTASTTATTSSTSSSSDPNNSDSFLESSSGNEAASGIHRSSVDHWAGRVGNTRRKEVKVSLFARSIFYALQEMPYLTFLLFSSSN